MKIYQVGGAVRDRLLGNEPKDRDWVIVGASEEDVANLLNTGFTLVGNDFPVYLHPETGEEYALARIERKSGNGYNGFTFQTKNVSLKEDLSRRDLTINAIARDPETDTIFDPFNGQRDLKEGLLRHVSPAFAEDPLRVLRVARFAARYGFNVDPETMSLMTRLVRIGELDHLTSERVWIEFEKILSEYSICWGLEILDQCGALERLFGLKHFITLQKKAVLDFSEAFDVPIPSIFAVLFEDVDLGRLEKRMCLPSNVKDTLNLFKLHKDQVVSFTFLSSKEQLQLIKDVGGLRESTAFKYFIFACNLVSDDREWGPALFNAIVTLKSIDFESLLRDVPNGDKARIVQSKQVTELEKLKHFFT